MDQRGVARASLAVARAADKTTEKAILHLRKVGGAKDECAALTQREWRALPARLERVSWAKMGECCAWSCSVTACSAIVQMLRTSSRAVTQASC